jgi:hypothetical protein
MAGPTACERQWAETLSSFERNMVDLTTKHPDCLEEISLIQAGLITIGQLINSSGNGTLWRHLEGKALFSALCTCTPPCTVNCVTLANQNQNKRRLLRNFANRGDESETPQMNKPQPPRKWQAQASMYVISVYGHRLTCLHETSMCP